MSDPALPVQFIRQSTLPTAQLRISAMAAAVVDQNTSIDPSRFRLGLTSSVHAWPR